MYNFSEILEELTQIGSNAASRQAEITFTNRQLKCDGSVLTEIDLEVQSMIIDLLKTWRPGLAVFAEEDDVNDIQDQSTRVAVIDPIDGTDSYSQGMQTWAISIGIVDPMNGPIAGFIAAPQMGLCVVADEDYRITVIGETDNLKERFSSHHKQACFDRHNYNCICIKQESSANSRTEIESDLIEGNSTPCNG